MTLVRDMDGGIPCETLQASHGSFWRWKVIGYEGELGAEVWVQATLTGEELEALLEPGTDREEFLGTLRSDVTISVHAPGRHSNVHKLTRRNPHGINSLRWHLRVVSLEMEERIEAIERECEGLEDWGERVMETLAVLRAAVELIAQWPEDE